MAKDKKMKKGLFWKILLGIVLVLAIVITVSGIKGGKIMNATIEEGIEAIKAEYTVTELNPSDYAVVKINPLMKFYCKQYEVEDLGNLCVMTVNAGVMQMSSFILTPFEKNMPLLSLDFAYMLSIRKGYVETYDLVEDKTSAEYKAVLAALDEALEPYRDMADCSPESSWLDDYMTVAEFRQTTSKEEQRYNDLFVDSVKAYVAASKNLETISADAQATKVELTQDYCDNLISKGGISTTVFKNALGEETTRDFFNKVFFGMDLYR